MYYVQCTPSSHRGGNVVLRVELILSYYLLMYHDHRCEYGTTEVILDNL